MRCVFAHGREKERRLDKFSSSYFTVKIILSFTISFFFFISYLFFDHCMFWILDQHIWYIKYVVLYDIRVMDFKNYSLFIFIARHGWKAYNDRMWLLFFCNLIFLIRIKKLNSTNYAFESLLQSLICSSKTYRISWIGYDTIWNCWRFKSN